MFSHDSAHLSVFSTYIHILSVHSEYRSALFLGFIRSVELSLLVIWASPFQDFGESGNFIFEGRGCIEKDHEKV